MKLQKVHAVALAATLAVSVLAGCATTPAASAAAASAASQAGQPAAVTAKAPKYVFLFIGDGMSYPQFQAASDYPGAVSDPNPEILKGGKALNFMNFPVAGSVTTFDSTSFAPDSASTATSLSTSFKTHSGVVNMDETKTKSYETITEKLKKQLGYKIGIVSTVNLNHATPAAFYAHQPTHINYYEISEELAQSGFDYFAGGGLKGTKGKEKDKTDSYEIIAQAGYKVVKTKAEAEKLTAAASKAVIIGETLADSDSLSYANGKWRMGAQRLCQKGH